MPIIIGSILFGAFAITATIVEGDLQPETARLTSHKRKSRRGQSSVIGVERCLKQKI